MKRTTEIYEDGRLVEEIDTSEWNRQTYVFFVNMQVIGFGRQVKELYFIDRPQFLGGREEGYYG